jgi:cell division protein FtsW (lipid II flippase)
MIGLSSVILLLLVMMNTAGATISSFISLAGMYYTGSFHGKVIHSCLSLIVCAFVCLCVHRPLLHTHLQSILFRARG